MKIRWKLMILLLAIALAPLGGASILDRFLTHRLGKHLAANTREILIDQARRRLELIVTDYGRLLDRDRRLLELALRLQARAVERRLAQAPPSKPKVFLSDSFPTTAPATEPNAPGAYYRIVDDGRRLALPVRFDRQAYFLAAGVNASAVADDMARLSTMPEVYQAIRHMVGHLVHWQYTALASGVHMSYPGHGGYPARFDPRRRAWYVNALKTATASWQPPNVDVTTGMVMVALSMPVLAPRGQVAGVTGIDVPMERIFRDLKLPEQWSADEATLLVYPGKGVNGVPAGRLAIVAQKGYVPAGRDWREPREMALLTAEDTDALESLRLDALAGRSGVREISYRGRQALWAYGAGEPGQAFPVVIVPRQRVIEQATQAERYVLEQTRQGLQITGAILLGVVGVVVVAAGLSSRSVTRPVNDLATASQQLARGDFQARVSVRTGDELQTLAEAFNDMGPKLAERERMKRSLELAMQIQQSLLPAGPPKLDGFDIAGRSVYCDETGGDYYDFIDLVDLAPGRLGIAVGDVTGHGIGAALLMASARAVLRSRATGHGADLAGLFGELNHHLVHDTGDGQFMTLFYGVLDATDRSLSWTSGGHDPPLWFRRAGAKIEELTNTGIPLGILPDATFTQAGPVRLDVGDLLLIGTDGIWEARNASGEMFGKQRLRELLAADASLDAQTIHLAVVQAVKDFRAGAPQTDDITLVVIKSI